MEVTIFSDGDSTDINLWSNVPYFVCKGFEDNGYLVNRVNMLAGQKFIQLTYDKVLVKFIKLFYPKSTYSYRRSFVCNYITNNIMKKQILLFYILSFI